MRSQRLRPSTGVLGRSPSAFLAHLEYPLTCQLLASLIRSGENPKDRYEILMGLNRENPKDRYEILMGLNRENPKDWYEILMGLNCENSKDWYEI
ncbi:hypothetical protein Droror1_Dr00026349 [Drosera rotundifolia]